MSPSRLLRHIGLALAITAVLVLGGIGLGIFPSDAETARVVPAPALDEPAGQATSETAVLAGGCFWGVQGVFQHVEGVTSAVSGYAGGAKETADYDKVGSGRTGHAEAVRITYDPRKVSFGRLLQIYFSVVHDPTELNRQGPDVGSQYRSTIFPTSASRRAWPRPISTSSTRRRPSAPGSSPPSNPAAPSIRPRPITRIT